MRAINIMWDIDEDIVDGSLPDRVEIPNGIDEEDVADWLSDTYAFCVFGFDIEQ